jgi:hypothetical protein
MPAKMCKMLKFFSINFAKKSLAKIREITFNLVFREIKKNDFSIHPNLGSAG